MRWPSRLWASQLFLSFPLLTSPADEDSFAPSPGPTDNLLPSFHVDPRSFHPLLLSFSLPVIWEWGWGKAMERSRTEWDLLNLHVHLKPSDRLWTYSWRPPQALWSDKPGGGDGNLLSCKFLGRESSEGTLERAGNISKPKFVGMWEWVPAWNVTCRCWHKHSTHNRKQAGLVLLVSLCRLTLCLCRNVHLC